MMDKPSISSGHLAELGRRFPYAFYVWHPLKGCYQLWCDEREGVEPYMFMSVVGPDGEYRDPGEWVIQALRRTDPETGEYQVGTKAGRKKWVQSLVNEDWAAKQQKDRIDLEIMQMRNSARFINHQGRVFGQGAQPKGRFMSRKLGG